MVVTNVVYQFWIYELCDVFIVRLSLFRRHSAQDTLYTCLDAGFKLLHLFMPFVTEELCQRLARRPGESIRTIVLTRYPIEEPSYADQQAEKDLPGLSNRQSCAFLDCRVQHTIQRTE
ncbi:hypothetical protein BC936DRAFT_142357 [Jimgerdemannia flammicorona]|uniref:valine--tRNA ligase n=1 Tax=Jimgerdemannia flammicorona TaxID=994334 RepID=A0A433A0P5_9FUNG|nr:hypothetical protein BC936DRAFT_142357 [Jimgerdemannia flammicorona]